MKLPSSLAPWAKILQIFPEEISLILGSYAQKISFLMTPLSSPDADEDGEPNGYDGVARRGIYERLLLSELALADDFGDEFVRRAVMGEHLFLNLAKNSPSSKRVSIAIFDAGAMQIGTPRIAHLAILIVLARRAEAAGAMFLWGVFEDSKQLVISDDTEASLKILLESRNSGVVTQEMIAAWREKLSDLPKKSDVWLIGNESLANFEETGDFSHLYVEEILELSARQLSLKIKSAAGAEKQTTLDLPHPDLCTRLLRNPFERSKKPEFAAKQLGGQITNFFFDPKGVKLFARLDSAEVLSFNVQNVSGTEKIQPTVYQQNSSERYIAAGRLKKAVAFLALHDYQTLRLIYKKNSFGLKEGLYQFDKNDFKLSADKNDLLPIYNLRPNNFPDHEAAVLDAGGNLFLLSEGRPDASANTEHLTGVARIMAHQVLAVTQTDREFIFVGCESGKDFHQMVLIRDKIEQREIPMEQYRRAIFGRGERGGKVLAFAGNSNDWKIMINDVLVSHTFEARGAVVGVCHDSRLAPSAGLFELMDDRRTIEFAWADERRKTILTANAEIEKIEFSPYSPVLAYQTSNGELIFFSLTHRTAIGRFSK